MAILAECPMCRRKQGVKNKLCRECGQDLDKAKRNKKVRYWIDYRRPNGKTKREPVNFSIEDARTAEGKRRSQKRENRLDEILDIQAEAKMTFSELGEWFLPLEQARMEVKGRKSFWRTEIALNNFNLVFGDRLVRDIKQVDLVGYQTKRKGEGISDRTIDYDIGAAKRMVRRAFYDDKVSGKTLKVFDAVDKLLRAGSNVRERVLEIDEYLSLTHNLANHLKPLVDVALLTGMRPGEMIPVGNDGNSTRGLTWDRVKFKNRMIVLEGRDTKRGKPRNIPITDELLETLRKIPRDIRSNHVFTYGGKPVRDIRKGLRKTCEDAGILYGSKVKGGFVFRDLRTTAKTLMARAGIDAVYRNALLGHEQEGMDRHYVHPDFDEDLRREMAKWTAWLNQEIKSRREARAVNR